MVKIMGRIINNSINPVFNNDNSQLFCSECKGLIISDNLRGDTICENCGLVESEKEINIKKLGRSFFGDPQKADRDLTSFLSLPDISYATYIDNKKILKTDDWSKLIHGSKPLRN